MLTPLLGRVLFVAALFPSVSSLAAQGPSAPGKAVASAAQGAGEDRFRDEPYIVQSLIASATMNADGTGTRVQTISIKLQADAVLRQFSVLSLAYADRTEKAEFVYARVLHSDGTTQATPVSETLDQPAPVTREAPFYSDLRVKQLPVRSLRVGDTLEWQSRSLITHPETPGQFWGQGSVATGAVVRDEVQELRVPAGFHLTVWTNPQDGTAFSETDESGQHVFRWRHSDLHPTVGAQADAARQAEQARKLSAEEELDLTKGKLPSFAWTTFRDWAAVGAWYGSLTADRALPDAAIKAKVAELIAGKTSDTEKARAIYSYVSTQIRYIGVAFGVGRYQPHTAAEVFVNQYGDCKDKHTLLQSMLAVAGLHADPVLIGAGVRFNAAVPSPAAFNHLITRLSLDGNTVWLDATAEVLPWQALVPAVRDQEALLIATQGASIVRTPNNLPYPAYGKVAAAGSLDKSLTSELQITMTYRDDDEIALRSVLRGISPSDYGAFMQNFMQGLGFGGTTSEPVFQHLDDTTQPLMLSFHYHRVKENDWGENRVTALFQPISLPSFGAEKPPTASIQLGVPRSETSFGGTHLARRLDRAAS